MWILLAICSSICLGIYDIFRKKSLNNNAVLPVLFFSNLTGALIFLPFILLSFAFPDLIQSSSRQNGSAGLVFGISGRGDGADNVVALVSEA